MQGRSAHERIRGIRRAVWRQPTGNFVDDKVQNVRIAGYREADASRSPANAAAFLSLAQRAKVVLPSAGTRWRPVSEFSALRIQNLTSWIHSRQCFPFLYQSREN